MRKTLFLKHINRMKFTKEFFLMKEPYELNVLFFSILLFFLVCIGIIIFGKIDDVVKVTGIVRTKGNVSSIKNVIPGKITELNYKPGQKVLKGDLLYKIDSTSYDVQRSVLIEEKNDVQKKINGIDKVINSFEKNINLISPSDKFFYSRFEAFLSQKKELTQKENLSKLLYDEENNNPEAIRNNKNIRQREMEYKVCKSELESFIADFAATIHSEKNELTLQLNKLNSDIQKLDNQFIFLSVCSPVDGYIQENSSLNVGDYLEENTPVLNIVPNDLKNFRVELQISPKDMGKIRDGLKVKYRLSAFPFFEYKGAEGFITSIDPDIRTENINSTFFYIIYADIDRTEFSNRHGKTFPIKAGLETDARIVLERSSILFYLLRKLDFLS